MERACRVMVVEDSETQAFKMRMLLEGEGCEVVRPDVGEGASDFAHRRATGVDQEGLTGHAITP